ncbi:MAG: tryptophan--tRNA ligase, partial [Candidatus Staskawiczbacteria bacterium]|nr:tryptophan--tRNA ligase [Candidatus Staskawiczbacteria bacterium]
SDPGKVEGNVVFHYLDIFYPDKEGLKKLKYDYRAGGLGDVVLKRYLIDVLENLINPVRTKRRLLAQDPAAVMKILKEGTEKTRLVTQETMKIVKEAVKINYWE